MSEDIYRSMPVSEEAEKAVLSCILKMPSKLDDAQDSFSPEWFYLPGHQKIYRAMLDVVRDDAALDLITLTEKLSDEGMLDEVGGRAGIAALLDEVPTASFFDHYAGILKEKYLLRQIIIEATNIVATAYDNPENAQVLADKAAETMGSVADCVQVKNEMPTMHERTVKAVARYEQAYNKKTLQGISTGLDNLDKMTGGLLDTDLIIIGARPSYGKTSLLTQVAGHIAINLKEPIGIFSAEMSGDGLTDRFFSQLASVNLRNLNGGNFDAEDFQRMMRQSKHLAQANIWIDDRAGITISEIRRAGRRMKQKYGVRAIFLDYLQRYHADTQKEDSDERARYGAVCSGLKDMAKELRIPVVALAQLSRRADGIKACDMHSGLIEGCSKIEQDADFIGLIGEPMEETGEDQRYREVDLNITKQRNGPCGIIPMRFRKAFTLFSEKVV